MVATSLLVLLAVAGAANPFPSGGGFSPVGFFLIGGVLVIDSVVSIYVGLMTQAAPYAFTFWVCDLIVTTIMRAINGGYLSAGRVK